MALLARSVSERPTERIACGYRDSFLAFFFSLFKGTTHTRSWVLSIKVKVPWRFMDDKSRGALSTYHLYHHLHPPSVA